MVNLSSAAYSKEAIVRLAVGTLVAAVGLLAVMEAPTHGLWIVAIGATEWGYWLVLPALAYACWSSRYRGSAAETVAWRWTGRLGRLLVLVGALLLLSPLARAWWVADRLEQAMAKAFPLSPAPRFAASPLQLKPLLSGAVQASVERRSLAYAERGGEVLALDLFRSTTPLSPAPAVIVVHGGSWQSGNRGQLADLNYYLASRGYVVASVEYRFAPRWPFPAARDDVRAALAYLQTHAPELGLDPNRLVLLGRSAGGQLALLVAYTVGDPAIKGAIAFYAPTDLRYSYDHPSNPLVLDSRGVLRAYLGGSPDERPEAYETGSPLTFVGANTPPTLLIHGGRDELVNPIHSERLAARLAQAARPVFVLRLPWATHGCDAHLSGPCGQLSTYAVERFLEAVTR
ncbi:MAG: alpha/beta hydrolase fold domain-containing protein [Nitrospiraceae bacterium]